MEEARERAEHALVTSGASQAVRSEVEKMAAASLPLSQKYRLVPAESMLSENAACGGRRQESLTRLIKALNILEKYGCNLTSPARPKYWRNVKFNNPVFRATVDAVQGGRDVLRLYGYTHQQEDGLGFPDDVAEPDRDRVAAVTVEVMALRLEVEMLVKDSHPDPGVFAQVLPGGPQQSLVPSPVVSVLPPDPCPGSAPLPAPRRPPKPAGPPASQNCSVCGGAAALICPACENQTFCDSCDHVYHRHPSRTSHRRVKRREAKPGEKMFCPASCLGHVTSPTPPSPDTCGLCGGAAVRAHCATCRQRLCLKCDQIFHSHPERWNHNRSSVPAIVPLAQWACSYCTTVNSSPAAICSTCDRPRLAAAATHQEVPVSPKSDWACKTCTMVNSGSSVLCEACERPRLATRPPAASPPLVQDAPAAAGPEWKCQVCTFLNSKPAAACDVCGAAKVSAGASQPPPAPLPRTRVSADLQRQERLKADGLSLMRQIREAEKHGISPEEVCAAVAVCGASGPCDWLKSELPHLLDEVCAMAESMVESQAETPAGGLRLSRAEAKLAWVAAGGDSELAARRLLRERRAKMKELQTLGFRDASKCEEALRQSGGDLREALALLQRPLLEPFHQHIWTEQPEPPIDPAHHDKQRTCRRLLALYSLPSWGRCELILSLLQEPDVTYSLEDVVQAVKESHDRDFIRRLLRTECPCCLSSFPRSKMQSLTSCQCSVCLECFGRHFTVAVKDRHIRDMVCPVCGRPEENDPEQLDHYFSTLDIQLRGCLEPKVYELFHKKLTEHTLMKDPKFLWCCHCTFGFINDGDQLRVTCPSCRNSFCAKCRKLWEPQHKDVSCDQFQQWKRENDPEYQQQGLAGYLRDNGITCPSCRFQYALTKGGCMHFICSQCRHEFCSGCNNPYHKTQCKTAPCSCPGLHAHHPRDCLFYLRDWEPARLQELLQRNAVEFNTDGADAAQPACGVMVQKDETGPLVDSPCGADTQPGHAGLCEKHYREYLVNLINAHSLDPAPLYQDDELIRVCERHQVNTRRGEGEEEQARLARLMQALMKVPLGDKVPRNK
ncbi:E3 ubiquitin-protein ligase RNF31-like [Neosynchiropus ocellatus]